jgi:hypothetical protein
VQAQARLTLCPTTPHSKLQACLDDGGLIELQPGGTGYILQWGLNITVDGTQLDSLAPPAKASLMATDDFFGTLLHATSNSYSVANMHFDGRRDNRTLLSTCGQIPQTVQLGPNLQFEGSGWIVHHVESWHAICGSAMVRVYVCVYERSICLSASGMSLLKRISAAWRSPFERARACMNEFCANM